MPGVRIARLGDDGLLLVDQFPDLSSIYLSATSGGLWRFGHGAPTSGVGNDGDFYLNIDNEDYYGPKTSGAWGAVVSNLASVADGTITDAKINVAGLSPSVITGTAVVNGDIRMTNARTPTSHHTSHELGGDDEISGVGTIDGGGA